MSFLATLKMEEAELNVLECSFEYNVDYDPNGRPTSRPRGGLIYLEVESSTSFNFFSWLMGADNGDYKNGEITFFKRDMMSSYKTMQFHDAACVHYKEVFSSVGEVPMKTSVVISAQEISVDDTIYITPWYSQSQ